MLSCKLRWLLQLMQRVWFIHINVSPLGGGLTLQTIKWNTVNFKGVHLIHHNYGWVFKFLFNLFPWFPVFVVAACILKPWCVWAGATQCVPLTADDRRVDESGGLQDDNRQVVVHLPGLVFSAEGQEDWRAPSSNHGDPTDLQRRQLSFGLNTQANDFMKPQALIFITKLKLYQRH